MRRPQGYSQLIGPGLENVADPGQASLNRWGECDTFTCGHCQRIVHVPTQQDASNIGGLCKVCDSLVCDKCVDLGMCEPFEKKIEQTLKAQYFRQEWF